jgi:branched-chain amino acid transport system permease protein
MKWVWLAAVVAVAIALPFLIYPVLAVDILCWGLFALAFDLVFGYAGLLSFGHAAFWGAASYVCANLLLSGAVPVPLAILLGALAALVLALPIGYLSIRSAGIYFAMITLAFAQMVDFVALQWSSFTGGENGIPGIPRPRFLGIDFDNALQLYFFSLVAAGIGYFIAGRAVHSPFGHALRAIRDNRNRALSVGYNPRVQMLIVFVLSAFLAGLAGAVNTVAHAVVSLDSVNWTTSGIVVMMTLLGGSTTLAGPLVGATLVLLLRDALASSTAASGVVEGAVFAVTVLFFRRGVVGSLLALDRYRAARAHARTAAVVAAPHGGPAPPGPGARPT